MSELPHMLDAPLSTIGPAFQIQCVACDGLGIVFECTENAPSTTPINCRHCGALRGTLGDLRELAKSERQDLF